MTARALSLLALAIVIAGCGNGQDEPDRRPDSTNPPAKSPAEPLRFAAYLPPMDEPYRNGKRIAARIAQRLLTYPQGTTAREVAETVSPASMTTDQLRRVVAPVVDPATRSGGEVNYVQLSGITTTSLGAMVVVRHHQEDGSGKRSAWTRVVDVRLRRSGGPWSLDKVASVGGRPTPKPRNLPAAATKALENPNIDLPDSARWDIYRGRVDRQLLQALVDGAEDHRFSITTISTGHPPNVWATTRQSAHSHGYAADIYAVDGALVLDQRTPDSSARRLAAAWLERGAAQVGSPWLLPPGGDRSFTDEVHQDHIHLQQTALP